MWSVEHRLAAFEGCVEALEDISSGDSVDVGPYYDRDEARFALETLRKALEAK